MKTSKQGKDLIKKWEALRLLAYKCSAKVWTIGWGHTENVFEGMKISIKLAEEFFEKDLLKYENAINSWMKAKNISLDQEEFDALVCFSFNVGSGNFLKSTMKELIERGEMVLASLEFDRWNKAAGKVLKGLINRRNEEEALWVAGMNGEELDEYERLIREISSH